MNKFAGIPIYVNPSLPKDTIVLCPPLECEFIMTDSMLTIETVLDAEFLQKCGIIRNLGEPPED